MNRRDEPRSDDTCAVMTRWGGPGGDVAGAPDAPGFDVEWSAIVPGWRRPHGRAAVTRTRLFSQYIDSTERAGWAPVAGT